MRIPIAKDGYIFILPLAVLTGIFWALSWFWVTGLFVGLFLFVTWFFRDPERSVPEDPNAIVSPGDGKIVEIISEKDPLLDEAYTRVSIFLNVFNVHVNRVPISGKYRPPAIIQASFSTRPATKLPWITNKALFS